MLHKETVDASTLELLKQLMADRRLKDFVLVGGTALSLQMGHRISVDLDLFVNQDFEAEELREYMERKSNLCAMFSSGRNKGACSLFGDGEMGRGIAPSQVFFYIDAGLRDTRRGTRDHGVPQKQDKVLKASITKRG